MKQKIVNILTKTPGLTGREIARSIGIPKKEVNSFLAKDGDGLVRRDWKWFVDSGSKAVLQLPENAWITAALFEEAFMQAGCVLAGSVDSLIIQFPPKCRVLLIAGARIIALANQCVHGNKNITLNFERCANTRDYLDRLGFFDHLHPNVVVVPERPTESRAQIYRGNSENLVEIASIDLEEFDDSLPQKLTKAFSFHAGKEYYMAAFTVFSELIGNIQEHSCTPIPGFAALQFYRGASKHIQTVVSDSGLGIATTLKPNLGKFYPDFYDGLDKVGDELDVFLVEKALTEGGLSQFGSSPDVARGLGLKRSQDYAIKYNAVINVRQETFELKLKFGKEGLLDAKVEKDLPVLRGTQVCFDFYID